MKWHHSQWMQVKLRLNELLNCRGDVIWSISGLHPANYIIALFLLCNNVALKGWLQCTYFCTNQLCPFIVVLLCGVALLLVSITALTSLMRTLGRNQEQSPFFVQGQQSTQVVR